MKQIFLTGLIVLAFTISGFPQCDQTIIITAPKAEMLDTGGVKLQDMQGAVKISISKSQMKIVIDGDESQAMLGTIKDYTCAWTEAYKNGKASFKSVISEPSGETKDADVTIEGIGGKITFTMKVEQMQGKKIRVEAEHFSSE